MTKKLSFRKKVETILTSVTPGPVFWDVGENTRKTNKKILFLQLLPFSTEKKKENFVKIDKLSCGLQTGEKNKMTSGVGLVNLSPKKNVFFFTLVRNDDGLNHHHRHRKYKI
jgi:hypothetical protein